MYLYLTIKDFGSIPPEMERENIQDEEEIITHRQTVLDAFNGETW